MPKTNGFEEPGPANLANFNRMAYYAAAVKTGSFTAAASRLGITKAVVRQQVARLERECRTTLLTRTTRKVVATDAGWTFYQHCARVLKEADDAFGEPVDAAVQPSGTVRLTAPPVPRACPTP